MDAGFLHEPELPPRLAMEVGGHAEAIKEAADGPDFEVENGGGSRDCAVVECV